MAIILIGVAGSAIMLLTTHPLSEHHESYQLSHDARLTRTRLNQLLAAIHQYHSQHGLLPYHPDGSDSALYLLKDYVTHSMFSSTASRLPDSTPSWDNKLSDTPTTDWEYLNEQVDFYSNRIYITSDPFPHSTIVYIGMKHGDIFTRHFQLHPGRALLGNYVTTEGFIVPSKDVFDDWSRTSPMDPNTRTSDSQKLRQIVDQHQGITYQYEYMEANGIILMRRIISASRNVVIEERVQTDELGRIIAIKRTPDDWMSTWQSAVAK